MAQHPAPSFSLTIDGAEHTLVLAVGQYACGGATSVDLWEQDPCGALEPYATISVNLPGSPLLEPGVFYVKEWGENGSVVASLKAGGWIEPVPGVAPAPSGYIPAIPAYRLSTPASAVLRPA